MINKKIKKFVPKCIIGIIKQLQCFKILSTDYGQFQTIKNYNCVDNNGDEIAWYTYPAIEYLNNIDFTEKLIFEYGSGNSSIYWGRRAKSVVSIEHDKEWYEKIKSKFKDNQTILFKENKNEYEKSISEIGGKFDVVIIDGERRVECSQEIEKYLNKESREGFMVILDNSDWYTGIAKYLRENLDLIEIDFHGFGPINNYIWSTSVFISRNFKFKPLNNIQPYHSLFATNSSNK